MASVHCFSVLELGLFCHIFPKPHKGLSAPKATSLLHDPGSRQSENYRLIFPWLMWPKFWWKNQMELCAVDPNCWADDASQQGVPSMRSLWAGFRMEMQPAPGRERVFVQDATLDTGQELTGPSPCLLKEIPVLQGSMDCAGFLTPKISCQCYVINGSIQHFFLSVKDHFGRWHSNLV